MEFGDMVPSTNKIEAFSLEQFYFPTPNVVEGTVAPSEDGFEISSSRNPLPKTVSPAQHSSKVGQLPAISLKSLSDLVDAVAKDQQGLTFEQNKMMQLMTSMKNEISSKILAIMAILFYLQGSRSRRVDNQTQFSAKGK